MQKSRHCENAANIGDFRQKKNPQNFRSESQPPMLAEGEGFEPPEPCGSPVFKTAAFNHSANPPWFKCWYYIIFARRGQMDYRAFLKKRRISSAVVHFARSEAPFSARRAREMKLMSFRYGVCDSLLASVRTIMRTALLSIVS